jgi:aryl-alcohol dehydrogenase-like predicted oxidoreductase
VALDDYRLLGRSGLRVSPLSLGTMTFGDGGNGRNADSEAVSREMLEVYADAGGNFIDTANIYNFGRSEEIVGDFIANQRQSFVVGSKYSMGMVEGAPNASGNHRKNMMEAVSASLDRLGTDYLDLLWVHIWDFRTPIEEVMRGLDDLVAQGRVHYIAVSNAPAWKVAEANTLARQRGWTPFIAYQGEYNLIDRSIDRDVGPMCHELGLTLMPWSPLANGLLTGKYTAADMGPPDPAMMKTGGRKVLLQAQGLINERNLSVANAVQTVAAELGATASQVALAWLLSRPGRPLPVVGARTVEQLKDNLGCLTVELNEQQLAQLDEVSAIDLGYPHRLYKSRVLRNMLVDKGTKIEAGFGVYER